MKNLHVYNCPWHSVNMADDAALDAMGDTPCHCPKFTDDIPLSDDSQFQERLAIEIKNRIAYQAKDAWHEHLGKDFSRYPDYTVDALSKAGYEWRMSWMVENMAAQIARITGTLTDLLGVTNDLRALSQAKSPDEMEKIAGDLVRRDALRKQAE